MTKKSVTFYTTHMINGIFTEIAKREDGLYFTRSRDVQYGTKTAWKYQPKGLDTFKDDIREMVELEFFKKDPSRIRIPQQSEEVLNPESEYNMRLSKEREDALGEWVKKDMEDYFAGTGRYKNRV